MKAALPLFLQLSTVSVRLTLKNSFCIDKAKAGFCVTN
jgi:hypothetical protein